jgi:hypothetical protein
LPKFPQWFVHLLVEAMTRFFFCDSWSINLYSYGLAIGEFFKRVANSSSQHLVNIMQIVEGRGQSLNIDSSYHGPLQQTPLTILTHTFLEGSVSLLPFLLEFNSIIKLAKLDLEQFEIKKVQVLPRKYNGKIVF